MPRMQVFLALLRCFTRGSPSSHSPPGQVWQPFCPREGVGLGVWERQLFLLISERSQQTLENVFRNHRKQSLDWTTK